MSKYDNPEIGNPFDKFSNNNPYTKNDTTQTGTDTKYGTTGTGYSGQSEALDKILNNSIPNPTYQNNSTDNNEPELVRDMVNRTINQNNKYESQNTSNNDNSSNNNANNQTYNDYVNNGYNSNNNNHHHNNNYNNNQNTNNYSNNNQNNNNDYANNVQNYTRHNTEPSSNGNSPTYTTNAVNFSGVNNGTTPPPNHVNVTPLQTYTPTQNPTYGSGAGILSGQNSEYVSQQTNHYNTAFNGGTTLDTQGYNGGSFVGNEYQNYIEQQRREREAQQYQQNDSYVDQKVQDEYAAQTVATINNAIPDALKDVTLPTSMNNDIQESILPTSANGAVNILQNDRQTLSTPSYADTVGNYNLHNTSPIGSPIASNGIPSQGNKTFDMNTSYGGFNYGNNYKPTSMGGNTPYTTFANMSSNVPPSGPPNDPNSDGYKPPTDPTNPIHNYSADYFSSPFGNMNNAYGGQNLLLNPYMHSNKSGYNDEVGKAVQFISGMQDRANDAQGSHVDRTVRDAKDNVAMAMAVTPIKDIVDTHRRVQFEKGVTDYYNKNKIADNFKTDLGNHKNIDVVEKKFNEYKAKCSSYAVKGMDYNEFLESGVKGKVLDIKDERGKVLDKFDLSDLNTQNTFADAKVEHINRNTIMKNNNVSTDLGYGNISNADFNEMRQRNYQTLNKKLKLDGFKGTTKQMEMLRSKDRKTDAKNMFKDLSEDQVKEIEEFVEINGANIGAFHSVYVDGKQAQGASLLRSKVLDSTTGAGMSTIRNYGRISQSAVRTSIAARNKLGSKHVDKALEKLERNYRAGNLSAGHYEDVKAKLNAKKDVYGKSKELHGTEKYRGKFDKRKTSAYKDKKAELKDLKEVRKESVKKQRRNRKAEKRTTGHNEKSFLEKRRDYKKQLVSEEGHFPRRSWNRTKNKFKNGWKNIKQFPQKMKVALKKIGGMAKKLIMKLILPALGIFGLLLIIMMFILLIIGCVMCIVDFFSWGSNDDSIDTNQMQTMNELATSYENDTLIPQYKQEAKDGADLTGYYTDSDGWNKNIEDVVDIKEILDENNSPTNFCDCLQIFSLYSYYRQNHWDWQSDDPQTIFDSDIKKVINNTHWYDNVDYTDVYHTNSQLDQCNNKQYHGSITYSVANYFNASQQQSNYYYKGQYWTATGVLNAQQWASDLAVWSANCVDRANGNKANYTKTIGQTDSYTIQLYRSEWVTVDDYATVDDYKTVDDYGPQTTYTVKTVIQPDKNKTGDTKSGLWIKSSKSNSSLTVKKDKGSLSNSVDYGSLTASDRKGSSYGLYTKDELTKLGFSVQSKVGNANTSWYNAKNGETVYYRPVYSNNGNYQLIVYTFKATTTQVVTGSHQVKTGSHQEKIGSHQELREYRDSQTLTLPRVTYSCKGHCAGHVKVSMDLFSQADIRTVNNTMDTFIKGTHYSLLSEDELSEVEQLIGTYDTRYVDGVSNWKNLDVYFMGAENWMDDETIQNVVNALGTLNNNGTLTPAGGGAPGIINTGTTEGKQELINQGLSLCNGAFVYGHSGRGNLYATGGNTDCSGYVSRVIFQALKAQGVPDDDPRMKAIKQVPTTVGLLNSCPNGYASIASAGGIRNLVPGTIIVKQNKSADGASNGNASGASNHTMIYLGPLDLDGDGQLDGGGEPYVLECTTYGGSSGPMFHTRHWSYLEQYGYYCNWL